MGIVRNEKCEHILCDTLCDNMLQKVGKLQNADFAKSAQKQIIKEDITSHHITS